MVQWITPDAILTYDTDHSSPSELRVPCASPGRIGRCRQKSAFIKRMFVTCEKSGQPSTHPENWPHRNDF